MRLRFVPDWREAHRWISVQLAALITLLSIAYDYIPIVRENMPEGWVKYAVPLILLGRIINQKNKSEETDK